MRYTGHVTINPTIVPARLANQGLLDKKFKDPTEAVAWFGAAQGQDFYGVKWALGQRLKGYEDADIDKAFSEGKFLRTHAMRPTWHLVAPEDIRWLQMLTGPRVHAVNAYYYRQLELDDTVFKRSNTAIANALAGGKSLTRTELKQVLEAAGITAVGLRLGYLLIYAELEALICSGPIKGKQHTYALLEERVPKVRELSRDEALAELTRRYFTSHGPAALQDMSWWSGLTVADIKRGLEMNQHVLHSETIDGTTYWFGDWPKPVIPSPYVLLLPNYDEYLIAYKDRRAFFDTLNRKSIDMETLMAHFVVVDGQIVGGWRRTLQKGKVHVDVKLLRPLSKDEKVALAAEANRYGEFLGLAATLTTPNIH